MNGAFPSGPSSPESDTQPPKNGLLPFAHEPHGSMFGRPRSWISAAVRYEVWPSRSRSRPSLNETWFQTGSCSQMRASSKEGVRFARAVAALVVMSIGFLFVRACFYQSVSTSTIRSQCDLPCSHSGHGSHPDRHGTAHHHLLRAKANRTKKRRPL